MVLRLRIVEGLIETVLTKAPHIMEQAHDLRELHIVRRKPQMSGELHGNFRHIARMHFLDADTLHDLGIIGMIRAHIVRHPGMHSV